MVSVSAHAASPRQSARSSTNLRASRQSSWRTQRQRNVDSLTPGTGRGRRLGGDNPDSDDDFTKKLRELRRRADPPPFEAFGHLVPRAPSSHKPRYRLFGRTVAVGAMDGLAPAPPPPQKKNTAYLPAMQQQPHSSATKREPRQKGDRDPLSFRRVGIQLATIDCSRQAIAKMTARDNLIKEKHELRYAFAMLDQPSGDGVIDEKDLLHTLQRFRYEAAPGEARDILWEVDDDCDGGVNWEEFQALYKRVRHDKDGIEPRRLYTIVEFCLFDVDNDGYVDLNDVLERFYRRYGRNELFGKATVNGISTSDRPRSLSFKEFVKYDLTFYSISRQIQDQEREETQSALHKRTAGAEKCGSFATKPIGKRLLSTYGPVRRPGSANYTTMSSRGLPNQNQTTNTTKYPGSTQLDGTNRVSERSSAIVTHGIDVAPSLEHSAGDRSTEAMLTPRQGLRLQAESGRFRRGSLVLYKYHGLVE